MEDKAILFDGSRCTGCQVCVVACKERRGLSLAPEAGNEAPADAYERLADLDGASPMSVALTERVVEGAGLVWEAARRGCVRCAEAPCGQVCPTGALELSEEGRLVGPAADRCVSCGLCAMVCPTGAPRSSGGVGPVCLCDGCAAEVAVDGIPACVGACPMDALTFGPREEVLSRAQDRVTALQGRGFASASILGASEQGGHGVVQVLQHGAAGHVNEAFSTAEELPWVAGAKLAGPVSVAVLAAGGVGATVALACEANRARRERSEAVRAAADRAAGVPMWEQLGDGSIVDGPADDACGAESALDAAVRKRDALRARAAIASPAAAAAAAAAAAGEEPHFVPVSFDGSELSAGDDFGYPDDFADEGASGGGELGAAEGALGADAPLPAASALEGDTGEIPRIEDGAGDVSPLEGDTGEIPCIGGGTGEIPRVNDASDTGELYDVEDFRRLLAADIVAHHLAKKAVSPEEGDAGEGGEDAIEKASLDGEGAIEGAGPDGEGTVEGASPDGELPTS